jgi:hypothetical protein
VVCEWEWVTDVASQYCDIRTVGREDLAKLLSLTLGDVRDVGAAF